MKTFTDRINEIDISFKEIQKQEIILQSGLISIYTIDNLINNIFEFNVKLKNLSNEFPIDYVNNKSIFDKVLSLSEVYLKQAEKQKETLINSN